MIGLGICGATHRRRQPPASMSAAAPPCFTTLLLALFLIGGAQSRDRAGSVDQGAGQRRAPSPTTTSISASVSSPSPRSRSPRPRLKQKAIDMLIDERLQMQEAREQGVTPDEDEVNKILSDMAKKNNLDVDGLAAALGKTGVNIKTLKDRIKAQTRLAGVGAAQIPARRADRRRRHHRGDGGVRRRTQLRRKRAAGRDGDRLAAPAGEVRDSRPAPIKAPSPRGSRRPRICAPASTIAPISPRAWRARSVKTLADQKPSSLAQPARLLVTSAKIGQMTPPTISTSAVELYAVCGKRSFRGDDTARADDPRKLMNEEMMHPRRAVAARSQAGGVHRISLRPVSC